MPDALSFVTNASKGPRTSLRDDDIEDASTTSPRRRRHQQRRPPRHWRSRCRCRPSTSSRRARCPPRSVWSRRRRTPPPKALREEAERWMRTSCRRRWALRCHQSRCRTLHRAGPPRYVEKARVGSITARDLHRSCPPRRRATCTLHVVNVHRLSPSRARRADRPRGLL